ncbi:MAG: TetR/AcrR family transcriptional regulator [Bacteroidetes bacterium]|nr:TetR/AcrR family transcriptional regulator [Bacteroidota bacterium]MCH8524114.1 TetR/AcrR family transcriptional regulator [Balneolales bacterium]
MPKRTFINLPEAKRSDFIRQSMLEFSLHDYDTASISSIVKELGIAKGSVYQYFENKKDLWLYLRQQAEQERLLFLKDVYRSSFDDFYGYFAAIQYRHIAFAKENPVLARFLYRATLLESSTELTFEIRAWKKQQIQFFEKLVEAEKLIGSLDAALRTKSVALFLQSVSFTLREYLVELPAQSQVQAEKEEKKSVFSRLTGAFASKDTPSDPYEEAETLISELLLMVKKALKTNP